MSALGGDRNKGMRRGFTITTINRNMGRVWLGGLDLDGFTYTFRPSAVTAWWVRSDSGRLLRFGVNRTCIRATNRIFDCMEAYRDQTERWV